MAVEAPVRSQRAPDARVEPERDAREWLRAQIDLLRGGRWEAVDLEPLIETLEDMGDSQLEAFEGALVRVIEPLLKLQYSPRDEPRRGSLVSLTAHRVNARRRLRRSPSLARRVDLDEVYGDGRTLAARAFAVFGDCDPAVLPERCPYALDALLDEDMVPGPAPGNG
ncbi:MAG: DUF29 family protein [Alphaproteobacteria bacterium]|jgi:hypothetical protein|nr:DUF29 family protein [Alphaproteobacteria bacterium]